jgi:putative flavoprotein involved in K+ transport
MNALPGRPYRGPDPDGFMTAAEFATQLGAYARACGAPVREGCTVRSVELIGERFAVATDDGCWRAENVVLATGWCDRPAVPALARGLDRAVVQAVPSRYRNPASLPPGGVLVVGASATGAQLAHELALSGRDVVLAAGAHSRVPRRYRGQDIYRWLAATGSLDRTVDELPDPVRARREPSLQLVGRRDHADLDLAVLQAAGVTLAGRLVRLDGHRAGFADDLARSVAAAEARMRRVLAGIDGHIDRHDLARNRRWAPPAPVRLGAPLDELDLRRRGIGSVLWATGYRRALRWLRPAVLDRHGEIRQRRGVTPVPGLYVLGQRFQHFRSSNFIHGVGRDAAFVADHILERARRQATA